MTDKQKVKHAIEVLNTIAMRIDLCEADAVSILHNVRDLCKLLEKPHETDSQREAKEASQAAKDLCDRLWTLIHQRKHNIRPPAFATWHRDMDKILRLDGRDEEAIAEVIDWCQQDDFWQNNILSPAKLRKQLDKLELRMARDHRWNRRRSLTRPKDGKTAKERYMESINEGNSGVNE